MHYVRVTAVRWIDDAQPGWVEVRLKESDGTWAVLADKVPVFDDGDRLTPGVQFPLRLEVPCDVLEWTVRADDSRSAVIRLHFHIEDDSGRGVFNVVEDDVASRP